MGRLLEDGLLNSVILLHALVQMGQGDSGKLAAMLPVLIDQLEVVLGRGKRGQKSNSNTSRYQKGGQLPLLQVSDMLRTRNGIWSS